MRGFLRLRGLPAITGLQAAGAHVKSPSYVVNAIIDAAYASAKSGAWEHVKLQDWRGSTDTKIATDFANYDEQYYLIKEEILPHGDKKLILKDKVTGEVVVRDI